MKICYISTKSIHTRRWIEYFAERGHEVHLITQEYDNYQGVKIHVVNPKASKLSPFFKAIIIRNLVKKIKPDILHAHQLDTFGLYGALSGFHPFVVSAWGSDIVTFPEKSILHKFLVQHILKKADLVQCGDESLAERVKSLIGERSSIHIIKWGIDPDLFKPVEKMEKDERVRILYLRRSQEPYSVEILLYAIPEIIKKRENVEFLILKSGRELNKTFDMVKELWIEKYVRFIDEVPNDKLPKIMNSCDIYVDTFYRETPGSGIGMAALEAMSCGLPAVLSNTAGVDIHIKHKVNGYIYKGHDSNSLANAIIELIKDRNHREKLGENARRYIINNQNWGKNMKIMGSFYEKLTKGGIKP